MRMLCLGALLVAAALATPAQSACQQKRSRDASFVELAVPEGAPRPSGPADFGFVSGDTTLAQLIATVGPPDASSGTRISYYIWCLADGSEISVSTRDGMSIEQIRHAGKLLYKRARK